MYVWLNGANKICDFCIDEYILSWWKCTDLVGDGSRISCNPRPHIFLEITNHAVHWNQVPFIITARKQSLEHGNVFYTYVSFCPRKRRGGIGLCHRTHLHPRQRPLPGQTNGGQCSGRYASYLNAFLLNLFF